MLKNILRILAISGICLFVYYFLKEGPEQIWGKIRDISILNFLILISLRLVYWSVRSLNWFAVLNTFGKPPVFYKVLMARLGSHSIGYLTPTAKIGGEVIRVFLLSDIDKSKLTASVVIDKMAEFFASIIVISAGVLFSLFLLPLSVDLKGLFLLVTVLLIVAFFFLLKKQKDGFFLWFTRKIRAGKKYFGGKKEVISDTDQYISEFYSDKKGVLVFLFLSYIINYFIWITEVFLTLKFLGSVDITVLNSFLIVALGSLAFIFPLLPGSLGVFEVTYLGLFNLFGISPVIGVGYIIIRRILGLLLAGVGLIPIFRAGFNFGNR